MSKRSRDDNANNDGHNPKTTRLKRRAKVNPNQTVKIGFNTLVKLPALHNWI